MKPTRPSLITDLLRSPETAPAADETPLPLPPAKRGRTDIVHSSIYVPKSAYRKLREIALARECKVHDLILDGIDAVLREHGHPTTAELKRRSTVAP
jgi:hypothetical protein